VQNEDNDGLDTIDLTGSFRLISKTGRGVRIGTRAGRVMRITRLLRTTKVLSIYQNTKINMMNVNLATEGDSILIEESNENNAGFSSNRGDIISPNQQITKSKLKHL
jgi:hypothetical protein